MNPRINSTNINFNDLPAEVLHSILSNMDVVELASLARSSSFLNSHIQGDHLLWKKLLLALYPLHAKKLAVKNIDPSAWRHEFQQSSSKDLSVMSKKEFELLTAIKLNNIDFLKKEDINLDCLSKRDASGISFFEWASIYKHTEMLDYFFGLSKLEFSTAETLEYNKEEWHSFNEPEMRDANHAMVWAVKCHQVKTVKELIEKYRHLRDFYNIRDIDHDEFLIITAAKSGSLEITGMLLENGFESPWNPNIVVSVWRVIRAAANFNHGAIVDLFLNTENEQKKQEITHTIHSLIIDLVKKNYAESVIPLLNVLEEIYYPGLALIIAVDKGYDEISKHIISRWTKILDKEIRIEALYHEKILSLYGYYTYSAFILMIEHGNLELINFSLNNTSLDINKQYESYKKSRPDDGHRFDRPLKIAIKKGKLDIALLLLNKGAIATLQDLVSLIGLQEENKHVSKKVTLQLTEELSKTPKFCEELLLTAARNKKPATTRILLDLLHHVYSQNKYITPLVVAIMLNQYEKVAKLLTYRRDDFENYIINDENINAEFLAKSVGNQPIIWLIEDFNTVNTFLAILKKSNDEYVHRFFGTIGTGLKRITLIQIVEAILSVLTRKVGIDYLLQYKLLLEKNSDLKALCQKIRIPILKGLQELTNEMQIKKEDSDTFSQDDNLSLSIPDKNGANAENPFVEASHMVISTEALEATTSMADNNMHNYRQALEKYTIAQLNRVKKYSNKYNDLEIAQIQLSDCQSIEELQRIVAQLKVNMNKHTDKGLVGFFKATWARQPQSRIELDKIFDNENNLIIQPSSKLKLS